jgi:putative transposase
MSVEQKRLCIEPGHAELSIRRQCQFLGLSRASYYRQSRTSEETLALMRLINETYTRWPFYGTRKMRDWLRRQGHAVSRKRVQRLMRQMGLVSIAPKPNTSRTAPGHKVYPYLLKGLEIEQPNQVWASDLTYLPMRGGFAYLTVVMDWMLSIARPLPSMLMRTPWALRTPLKASPVYCEPWSLGESTKRSTPRSMGASESWCRG